MQSQHAGVVKVISLTKQYADAADTAALALKSGNAPRNPKHPLLKQARAYVLLGVNSEGLIATLTHVAERAEQSADKAERRLDDYADDFAATSLLAQLVTVLPTVGFNPKHPSVRSIRQDYHNAISNVRKAKS
jgi:hypothetical protein